MALCGEVRLHAGNSQLCMLILERIRSEDYTKRWIIPKSSLLAFGRWDGYYLLLLLFSCFVGCFFLCAFFVCFFVAMRH